MAAVSPPGRDSARRTVRLRAGVAAAVIAALTGGLGACTSGSPSKAPSSPAAQTPFVVARTGDIDRLDPELATAFQTQQTLSLVYSTLVTTSPNGLIEPGLAASWTTSDNGLTISFSLRNGVVWHDGSPFTSADVQASIQRILDPSTGAVSRSNLLAITAVDTPSPSKVVLHLSKPSGALLYSLASINSSIESKSNIAAGTVGKSPDGTGPFVWKQWDQGRQVVLTANPGYYGGKPRIGTLEFKVISDESSILSGMRTGAFQLGQLTDPGVARQASLSGEAFQLVKEPALAYHVLMLNGRRGPLRKQQVRQALACAINKSEVLQVATFGDGTVTGPITSPAFTYSPTDGLPCTPGDTAKAKSMLSAAGYPHGFALATIVETGEYATGVAEAQDLQAQLLKIGVSMELKQLPTAPYVTAWLAGDFDAAVALNGGSFDPYLMYGRYFGTGGSLATPGGLDSPTLAGLLAQGNASNSAGQRQAVYGRLQMELLSESPWVWLFRSDDYYLVGPKVQGFAPRPDAYLSSLAEVQSY
ncbi:ABC transporter substrate-binding protein [Streptacidiphilus rugosus]|uniref:ABC transporter substrate-binding protein n=1 Tax=Streptacidiphilus rugosus TaxID=405783 RepID=UPI0009FEB89A|nr:ABC transporter substrate-binding protein [Streptacidiphilus rugosus]